MRGRAVVLGAMGALAIVAACDGDAVYVYTGQRLDPARGCLEAYVPIEAVGGEAVSSTCRPICFTLEEALYVSTVCPPLPSTATEVVDDAPECVAARAAPPCEEPEAEGGAEADGEADGSVEDGSIEEGSEAGPSDADTDTLDGGDSG